MRDRGDIEGKPMKRTAGRPIARGSERTGFQRRLELVVHEKEHGSWSRLLKACGFGTWGALYQALALALGKQQPLNSNDARLVERTVRRWREYRRDGGPPRPRLLEALVKATGLPAVWWLYGTGPGQLASGPPLWADQEYWFIGTRNEGGQVRWMGLGVIDVNAAPTPEQETIIEMATSDTMTTGDRLTLARWLRLRRRVGPDVGRDAMLLEAAGRNWALAEPKLPSNSAAT
jgi:hypothetical protein